MSKPPEQTPDNPWGLSPPDGPIYVAGQQPPVKPLVSGDNCRKFEIIKNPNTDRVMYHWDGIREESDPYPMEYQESRHRLVKCDYYIKPVETPSYIIPEDEPVALSFTSQTYCDMYWEDRIPSGGPEWVGLSDFAGTWQDANAMMNQGIVSPQAMREILTSMNRPGTLGDNEREEDTLLEYVRHSKAKKPCKSCGSEDIYWAHETLRGIKYTGSEDTYCKKCEVAGAQMIVNEDMTLHVCVKPEAVPEGNPMGDSPGDLEPVDDDVTPPEERPDLQAPDAEEDSFLDGDVPPLDSPTGDMGTDPQDGESEPDEGQEEPPPAPPWMAQGESQGSGDDESEGDDQDDEKYVLRVEWMTARVEDGGWLDAKIDNEIKKRSVQIKFVNRRITRLHERTTAMSDTVKDHGRCIATINGDITKLHSIVRDCRKELSNMQENGVTSHSAGGETVIKMERPDGTQWTLPDLHHYQLPLILKYSAARMHTLMVGTPAVGKSKMARQVAKALELPFYALAGSLNPMTSKTDIVGYMNSTGDYIGTAFYDAFTKGGVMFLDEMDNAHPAALAAINDAAAIDPGETCGFPNGMQERHKDFILIGAANTFGRGPTQAFSGRQRSDAATWDRFNIVETQIDNVLEMTLASRTGAPLKVVDEIVRFVRKVRKVAAEKHLPYVITPRATVDMCKAYVQGIEVEEMIDARIRRGTSDQDWEKLTAGVTMLSLDDYAVTPWTPDPETPKPLDLI